MLYRYLGLAGCIVYGENPHFSGNFLSHQVCRVALQTQRWTRFPCPETLREPEMMHCRRGWKGL